MVCSHLRLLSHSILHYLYWFIYFFLQAMMPVYSDIVISLLTDINLVAAQLIRLLRHLIHMVNHWSFKLYLHSTAQLFNLKNISEDIYDWRTNSCLCHPFWVVEQEILVNCEVNKKIWSIGIIVSDIYMNMDCYTKCWSKADMVIY